MSLLSKLFGGGKPAEPEAEVYNGFRIFPEPIRDGGQFRIGARIEKDYDGETKTHQLIRADSVSDPEEAKAFSLRKAKQLIDEQGDRLFG